jgi:hypothetical protein
MEMGQPPMRTLEDKLYQLHDAPVVVGCSGAVGVAQNVRTALEGMKRDVLVTPIAKSKGKFQTTISKVLKIAEQNYVPIDKAIGPPVCDTLISGYTGGESWLVEVDRNGGVEQHEQRGFCALGSGGPFAHFACASMQHHAVRELGARGAQVLAYRTIDTAIAVAAFGLGPPVQMWVIDADGARRVEDDELQVISHTADVWKAMEAEALAGVVQAAESSNELAEPAE